jgi:hypothetical protein
MFKFTSPKSPTEMKAQYYQHNTNQEQNRKAAPFLLQAQYDLLERSSQNPTGSALVAKLATTEWAIAYNLALRS